MELTWASGAWLLSDLPLSLTKSLSHCSGLEVGTVVCQGVTSYFMSRMLCGLRSLRSVHLASPGMELLTSQYTGAVVIKGPVFFASCTWVRVSTS